MQVYAVKTNDALGTLAQVFGALAENRREREENQLTCGKLIEQLGSADPKALVKFDDGRSPGELHSYRGFYQDLGVEPCKTEITVEQFLQELNNCLGKTYRGYRGGDYVMTKDCPVWEANWGSTGRVLLGIEITENLVTLQGDSGECSDEEPMDDE